MKKPTKAQLDADIAEFLRTGGSVAVKPRGNGKPKATEIETLSDEVEQAKAAVRAAFKHGDPPAHRAEVTEGLNRKLRKLASAVGTALGHVVHGQGHAYECARCGASGECGGTGLFDTEPRGAIFREECQLKNPPRPKGQGFPLPSPEEDSCGQAPTAPSHSEEYHDG